MTTPTPPDQGGANTLPIGFTLAEFRIEHVIGEGGFGIVYMATDTQLGRKVAIKEYMPASLASRKADLSVTVTSPRHKETFDLGLRSFVKEAITLARFDHPALLKVFRFWEERGTAYMVMPYLEGQTLKQFLRSRLDAPPEAWLRTLLEPVLDGLEHLHSHNILHRDIAPDNIQILPSGVPLLLDFGAARQVIGDATQALTVILKPGFAPIEQYAESAAMRQGAWTDVYALAAVCYYAISGKTPQASVSRVLHDDMPSAASIGSQRYSAEFLNFIDVCLRVRPEQRPQTIREARDVMMGLAAAPAVAPAPPPVDDDRTVIRPSARAPAAGNTDATIAQRVRQTTPPTTAPTFAPTRPAGATPATAAPAAPAATPATAMPLMQTAALERTTASAPASAPAAAPAPATGRRVGAIVIGALAMAGLGVGAWKFWPTTNPVPPAPAVASSASAPTATPASAAASMADTASAPATAAASSPAAVPTAITTPAPSPAPAPATATAPAPSPAAAPASPTTADASTAPAVEPTRRPAATAPAKKPAADSTRTAAKPANENAAQCAQLLQQASMGQDTPDIARRMAALHCR